MASSALPQSGSSPPDARVPTLESAPPLAEPSLSELVPPCAPPSLLLALLLLLPLLDASLADELLLDEGVGTSSIKLGSSRPPPALSPKPGSAPAPISPELPDGSDPPESLPGVVSLEPGAPGVPPPLGSLPVLGEPPPLELSPIGGLPDPLGLDDPPDEPPDELELELELELDWLPEELLELLLEELLEELELGELGTGIDTVGGVGILVLGGVTHPLKKHPRLNSVMAPLLLILCQVILIELSILPTMIYRKPR